MSNEQPPSINTGLVWLSTAAKCTLVAVPETPSAQILVNSMWPEVAYTAASAVWVCGFTL